MIIKKIDSETDIIYHHSGNFNWSLYSNKKIVVLENKFPKDCIFPGNFYFSPNADIDGVISIPLGPKINIEYIECDRDLLCFSQFTSGNGDRKNMTQYILKNYIDNFDYDVDTYKYNLFRYKYTISPHGFNPDCFRHWEAILCGCIPITIKHKQLESFYDAPILFLNDWSELNEQLLIDKYDELLNKSWEMATEEYWINYIKNYPI